MRKVTILTDGGTDLKTEIIDKYELTIIPYRIIFGDDVYFTYGNDNTSITREEFYNRLAKCGKDDLPHTSIPSPGIMMKAFDEALTKSDSVLAILLSSKQSGTIDSARRLLMNRYPDKDITVYDSNQVMSGIAVQVLLASQLAAEGKSKEEIIARLNELNKQIRTIFVFQNLHYLYLGGRIGRAKKLMASALNINPVLYVDGGVMEGLGILKKGKLLPQLKQYATKVVQNAKTNDIFLWHTRNKALTDEIYQAMQEANTSGKTIHYQEASPLPAVYGGPNGLSISYIGDWDKNWLFG